MIGGVDSDDEPVNECLLLDTNQYNWIKVLIHIVNIKIFEATNFHFLCKTLNILNFVSKNFVLSMAS